MLRLYTENLWVRQVVVRELPTSEYRSSKGNPHCQKQLPYNGYKKTYHVVVNCEVCRLARDP
ncbi:hypothetical protein B7P43_G02632 [Cryptotermes secundus]|uniref:Uncharacterized protein n=1 Tax=Cryptotermes secundus TaxID=105785 RepID=A0A2J7PP53_9NEOP|nr:hypothetical protein B7P43_G02632 [Cryptotermes secundus]